MPSWGVLEGEFHETLHTRIAGRACPSALPTCRPPAAKADAFEDILKKGVVRIAAPLDVPPFGSQNEKREPEGFDIELAGMVAKALGVKLELQQVTGANRIPFLLTDKVDIVISVMGLTPERAKQIMFTAPYADTQLAVFGPKSANVTSADEIGSLKVAAAKGTTQELGAVGDGAQGHHHAHRGRRHGRRRLRLRPGRAVRHQQPDHPRPAEAQPEQGVRPQVRDPPQPGAHGRAHGRAQSAAAGSTASSSST